MSTYQQTAPNWNAVRSLTEAFWPRLEYEVKRLRELIKRSNDGFAPFSDPLLVDFGTHRWLSSAREEPYSDWLEWILQRLILPERVCGILDLNPPTGIGLNAATLSRRELPTPSGHAGRSGRLDLLIRYDDKALICVEVKLGDADSADTKKQVGYRQYLDTQTQIPNNNRHAVLLVTEAAETEYAGNFKPVRWSDVCVRLRRMVPALKRDEAILAAMILAFVGAVEQNVLRFSSMLVRQAFEGKVVLLSSEIGDHIQASLNEEA